MGGDWIVLDWRGLHSGLWRLDWIGDIRTYVCIDIGVDIDIDGRAEGWIRVRLRLICRVQVHICVKKCNNLEQAWLQL